jgi:hypothetical protein
VFDHHDLCPELYGSRFPAGPRLPYHGLRAFERRTHWAADHVISTNDSYRETAMRPRVGQDKGQRAELTEFVGTILTGAPMPISVGSLVATTRATIAVGYRTDTIWRRSAGQPAAWLLLVEGDRPVG